MQSYFFRAIENLFGLFPLILWKGIDYVNENLVNRALETNDGILRVNLYRPSIIENTPKFVVITGPDQKTINQAFNLPGEENSRSLIRKKTCRFLGIDEENIFQNPLHNVIFLFTSSYGEENSKIATEGRNFIKNLLNSNHVQFQKTLECNFEDALKNWESSGDALSVYDIVGGAFVKTFMTCFYGMECFPEGSDEMLAKFIKALSNEVLPLRIKIFNRKFDLAITPSQRRFNKYKQEYLVYAKKLVALATNHSSNNNNFVMSLIKQLEQNEGQKHSIETYYTHPLVVACAPMLLITTTSAKTLFCCILPILALYPQVRLKLKSEIMNSFDNPGPYFKKFFKEILRYVSPTNLIVRTTWKDILLNGHFIPAKSLLCISNCGIAFNEKFWNNPHVFDPDRVEFEGDKPYKLNQFPLIPVMSGERVCPASYTFETLVFGFVKICILNGYTFFPCIKDQKFDSSVIKRGFATEFNRNYRGKLKIVKD